MEFENEASDALVARLRALLTESWEWIIVGEHAQSYSRQVDTFIDSLCRNGDHGSIATWCDRIELLKRRIHALTKEERLPQYRLVNVSAICKQC